MNLRRIRLLLLLFAAILWNVLLTGYIEEKALQINCFSYETAYQNFRDHQVKEKVLDAFYEAADADMEKFSELLTMYFATGDTVTDVDVLEQDIAFVKKYKAEEFDCVKGYVYAVWNDLARFPVGTVQSDKEATVSFADRGFIGFTARRTAWSNRSAGCVSAVTGSESEANPALISIMRISQNMRRSLKSVRRFQLERFSATWEIPVTATSPERREISRCICISESI